MSNANSNQSSRSVRDSGHSTTPRPSGNPHSYPPRSNTSGTGTNSANTRDRSTTTPPNNNTSPTTSRTFTDYYAPTRASETPSETAARVSRNFLFLPESQRPRTDDDAAALLRRCGPTVVSPLGFGTPDFWRSSMMAQPDMREEDAPTGEQMISLWIASCFGLLKKR